MASNNRILSLPNGLRARCAGLRGLPVRLQIVRRACVRLSVSLLLATELSALGAAEPAGEPVAPETAVSANGAINLAERKASHWAWQPVERPDLPKVTDATWVRAPLDAFILHGLEEAGLRPAPAVERLAWLRRVSFDLTGLPPTRAAIEAYLNNPSPTADSELVELLLASPSFGETWAQHWLDLVRFAETKGHEQDFPLPHAWRYRDYVIRALNSNVPFDQFVREHIAGDLLAAPRIDPETRTNQSIQGTGFWYLGEATHSPVDIRGDEADRMDNQIDVFGKVFLGLTVACARCHDHKFDAISTADYYALCGFLQSSSYQVANVADPHAIAQAERSLRDLNRSKGRELYARYCELTDARLASFAADLLAAADEARQLPSDPPADAPPPPAESPTEQLARELLTAKNAPQHPLYPFALVATSVQATTADANSVEQLLAEVNSSWRQRREQFDQQVAALEVVSTRKEGELNRVSSRAAFDPARHLIVDFSLDAADATRRHPWITSGSRFGKGPLEVGTPILAGDGNQPLRRLVSRQGASADGLSGKLTGMVRTRTFEVAGDRLWYHFRGKAKVFLDVDSHRTLGGPLHGVVQRSIDSGGQEGWFAHPVSDYLGHRVHVEFEPQGDFELYAIRFGAEQPPVESVPNRHLVTSLANHKPTSLPGVAAATVDAFRAALETAENQPADADTAVLVNWLLAHDPLLPAADARAQAGYQEFAQRYQQQRATIESTIPEPVWALAMLDGSGEDVPVHIRGNHKTLESEPTPRRFLDALGGQFPIPRGSGRLELAERVVDSQNPLTARTFVNRAWHHLFGRGIAPSVDNLGYLGTPPTHPELLDYLAAEFVAHDWNIKELLRQLTLSSSYRMSTLSSAAAQELDPGNKLLHAARARRLTGEQIRDAVLAVSGDLDHSHFGQSVPIHITEFMRHNRSPSGNGPLDGNGRRSIYVEVRRNSPSHFLTAFDKPTAFTTAGRRTVSNSAAQPLILLNDPLVHRQAQRWATRLVDQFATDEQVIEQAYLQAFTRQPTAAERVRLSEFLHDTLAGTDDRQQRVAAWTEICLTLFNVKEFIFLL